MGQFRRRTLHRRRIGRRTRPFHRRTRRRPRIGRRRTRSFRPRSRRRPPTAHRRPTTLCRRDESHRRPRPATDSRRRSEDGRGCIPRHGRGPVCGPGSGTTSRNHRRAVGRSACRGPSEPPKTRSVRLQREPYRRIRSSSSRCASRNRHRRQCCYRLSSSQRRLEVFSAARLGIGRHAPITTSFRRRVSGIQTHYIRVYITIS